MEDFGENQALLIPDSNERLRYPRIQNTRDLTDSDDESCQSDEWWDGTGSSSCSSCESELGSEADWETKVDERGELFYIESTFPSVPDNVPSSSNNTNNRDANANTVADAAKKKSTRGKLVKLIRRRSSRRSMKKKPADNNDKEKPASGSSAKVTFRDSQEGEVRTVKLRVSNDNMGRRATLCESLLGIITSTFTDGSRIMVAGFVPNSEAMKHRSIKIGDWLRSVNDQEVTIKTIDSILRSIRPTNEIELKLQKVAACDITAHVSSSYNDDNSTSDDIYQSDLVHRLLGGHNNNNHNSAVGACALSVLYLQHSGLSEDGPADEGVVYSWPRPQVKVNDLYAVRGAFITLHHLLVDLSHSPPISTSIVQKGSLTHVIYTPEGSELLLIGIPHKKCSLLEARQLSADIVRCLKFKYQTLSRCFGNKEHGPALERLFSSIWLQVSTSDSVTCAQFEHRFPAAHYMPLPRDAQIQIDDALSEFEANDFGSYTEDHHGSQRLYSIIGTCFFYKGYLLGSHLPSADLVDVSAFCRQTALLSLSRQESLRRVVLWRQVYPLSCNRGLHSTANPPTAYHLPNGRWFMLIVGQGNSLLVTIFESAGCTIKAVGNPGPDIDYVQQAQATLKHIHKIGVPVVAEKWISNCVRPQVIAPDSPTKVSPKRASNENSQLSKSGDSPTSKSLNTSNSSSNSKKLQEITSILKRRGSPNESSTAFPSGLSQQQQCDTTSEGSSVISGGGGGVGDEMGVVPPPIVGRRAERERGAGPASASDSQSRRSDSDDDLSDSDWAPYMDHRRMYGSRALDMVDLGKTLLSDVSYTLPSHLLAGSQNTLFHYVQLDLSEGLLLSPAVEREVTSSHLFAHILAQFRACALQIHTLLQNTVNFKQLKVHEIHESHMNKSLVAIKEHGVLFETSGAAVEGEGAKKMAPICFWVVGRLFFNPHPKEVYVCYQESASQNMVEIAFRLALSTSG